jgi:hypothetical protein
MCDTIPIVLTCYIYTIVLKVRDFTFRRYKIVRALMIHMVLF